MSLLGRFLIILGGAFLLRAATDSGTLPPTVGVIAGLVYGIAQLWLASRAAARDDAASAGGAPQSDALRTRRITNPRIQKPGLALAGYLPYVKAGRLQILGESEYDFLATFPNVEAEQRMRALMELDDGLGSYLDDEQDSLKADALTKTEELTRALEEASEAGKGV